jgi:ABC-type uncharacterized transport system auxiliary subunit
VIRPQRTGLFVVALLVAASTTLTSGCFRRQFPERRQYVLNMERVGPGRELSDVVIKVGRVRSEPPYERKAFVYRTGESTYTDDFYSNFYVSPTQLTRSTLHRWISDSGMFANVADVDSLVAADWLLESRLLDFYIDRRPDETETAVVRLALTLVDARASPPRAILECDYEGIEPVRGHGGDDAVAAWNGALTKIYTKLEADLAEMLLRRRGS